MLEQPTQAINHIKRRAFISGSGAQIIMGADEPALPHRWREHRGEVAPPMTCPPTPSSNLA
jgi:hypothetical protein